MEPTLCTFLTCFYCWNCCASSIAKAKKLEVELVDSKKTINELKEALATVTATVINLEDKIANSQQTTETMESAMTNLKAELEK